ncbi:NIPSNAP family protein [Acuticoccus sediminis]|uniref:NIPSNAP family protein n=1 Tax=Acuticoccus sediminis TaxID=2184697 RepID=A0A8B2NT09_9HYPH|nr:NIPSNAP family protein [Acuticoccus sediminis]RAI01659.1 NIPSNAP family protein [Acuticoccus sediminis]
MIYEERDYHVKPGKLAEFVNLYKTYGVEIQKKYLGTFIGYFTSEIGELNHVVALWGYEGLDDRLARRRAMLADPEWQDYMRRVDGLLAQQNSRVLLPTDFSPLQ